MVVFKTCIYFFLSLRSMIDTASLVRGNGKLSLIALKICEVSTLHFGELLVKINDSYHLKAHLCPELISTMRGAKNVCSKIQTLAVSSVDLDV